MTVSVLLPVYNAERTLVDALQSLFQQPALGEIVIVNDGSTDATGDIVERYAFRQDMIRFVRLRYHYGATVALRVGLEMCRGEYVARQDADDLSWPGRLARQAAFLEIHPRTVLVASRASLAVPGIRGRCRWLPRVQLLLGRNPILHGSAMFRREAALAVGGYREVFTYAQDLDLWHRLARVGRFSILPEILYHLGQHEGQVTARRRREQLAYAVLARWAMYCGGHHGNG